jgi:hypothetical protein
MDEAKTVILHTVTDPLAASEANACMLRMCEMVASVDHPVDVIGDRTKRNGIVTGAIRMMRENIEPHVPANLRYFIIASPDYAIRYLFTSAQNVLPRLLGRVQCVSSMPEAQQLLNKLRQAAKGNAASTQQPTVGVS